MKAGHKWLELFLDILGYEFAHTGDGQLLSEGADRLVDRFPVTGRVLILSVGTIITLHLANVLDDRYDIMAKRFWGQFRGV